ncbi:MAG: serine/threonine-protein kinase, partial [Planctomycetaceae bacterium]
MTKQVAEPTIVGYQDDSPRQLDTSELGKGGAPPATLETGAVETEDYGPQNRPAGRSADDRDGGGGAGSGAPQFVGRYRLVKLLGEGGFGRVWKARDEELRRDVAIKVPKPERFQSAEDVEQYLAEARTLAALRHPHIVPVYDLGRDANGLLFVVSLLIPGETLRDELRRGRVTHERAVEVILAMAAALDHAHAQQLIHRDVKPENILVEHGTRHPWLTD